MKTTIRLSNLLFKKYPNSANKLTDILDKHKISFEKLENTKDIWTRDYMPICLDDGTLVSYIYEPDYLRNEKDENSRTQIEYENNHMDIIMDGGNFVRYKNKAIMTDKIFKENPNKTEDSIINIIKLKCKLDDLIIIPKQPYDTFGHSDSMVRWIDKDTVLVNDFSIESKSYNEKLLKVLKSHNLNIKSMKYSDSFFTKDRNWGAYLNFIKIKNILIVPIYGIAEDTLAINQIKNIFDDCIIETIEFNEIINEGGAVHCITNEKINIDEYLVIETTQKEFKTLRFKLKNNEPFILEYKEFVLNDIESFKCFLQNQNSFFTICFDKNLHEFEIKKILQSFEKSNIKFDVTTDDIFALSLPNKEIKNGWVNLSDKRNIVLNGLVWSLVDKIL